MYGRIPFFSFHSDSSTNAPELPIPTEKLATRYRVLLGHVRKKKVGGVGGRRGFIGSSIWKSNGCPWQPTFKWWVWSEGFIWKLLYCCRNIELIENSFYDSSEKYQENLIKNFSLKTKIAIEMILDENNFTVKVLELLIISHL